MKHAQKDQNGMVAIVIAMFMMIVMTLITLGFARLMRREQRQALDNSLSTQAYYAAESGINDAIEGIKTGTITTKTTCDVSGMPNSGVLSITNSYSCVLVDNAPTTIAFDNGKIGTDRSTVIPVASANGQPLDSLTVSWSSNSSITPQTFRNCGVGTPLPTYGTWGATTGILRLDVVPADGIAGVLTRDGPNGLIETALNLYLYPCNNSSGGVASINYNAHATSANQGQLVGVNCNAGNTPRDCNLTINLATGGPNNKKYYVRMRSIYSNSNVTIAGTTGGSPVGLSGAQVKIDSTGKVSDVVKRLQVRVPIKQYAVPEFVLQSMDGICKKIEITPTTYNNTCPL